MHPVYKNDELGHIMAQNDEHGLEKHLAGGKNPWAPFKGPLRALSWQKRGEKWIFSVFKREF